MFKVPAAEDVTVTDDTLKVDLSDGRESLAQNLALADATDLRGPDSAESSSHFPTKQGRQGESGDLTYMHKLCIFMHMRTTLNIDDSLLHRAAKLTGITEKTSLVHLGLEALIARESARRLAELGGSERNLKKIPRRRAGNSG
jgi:Arc/MetJ family transcription regulator